jgi:hypothetical protein
VEGAVSTELCERARETAARLAWRHDGKSWAVDDVNEAGVLLVEMADALEAAEKRATDAELRVKTAVVYLRAMVASECPSCRLDARSAIEQFTRFAPSPALARRGGEGGVGE